MEPTAIRPVSTWIQATPRMEAMLQSDFKLRRALRANRGLLLFLLLLALFRTSVADWSYVPSGSMEPTLFAGDYIWVDKTAFGPTLPIANKRILSWGEPLRGDVITFVPPHRDDLFVKRVIAIPGDVIRIEGSAVFVNGRRLETVLHRAADGRLIGEERIDGRGHLLKLSPRRTEPASGSEIVVPADRYFVMGDHRTNSADSRVWGFVKRDSIMGRVTHVAVSFSDQRTWNTRFAKAVR